MELSKSLKELISAALADNKISSKEKEILTKRAVTEGVDKDEFELYLDSLEFSKKEEKTSSSEGMFNKVIYHRKAGFKQEEVEKGIDDIFGGGKKEFQEVPVEELKIRLWHVLVPGILVISSIITGIFWPYAMSVDDALNVYDFEAARAAASEVQCLDDRILGFGSVKCQRTLDFVKIITQEVSYMTDNNEFDKAAAAIQELNTLEFFEQLNDQGQLQNSLDSTKDALYLALLSKGIINNKLSAQKVKMYLSLMKFEDNINKVKVLLK
jgi:hypothetical protein